MKNTIDLHTHSVLSKHAYSSLTENIEYASSIGLEVYGISEHQPDPVNVGAHCYAFKNCFRITPKQLNNTKILVGIELNILEDGIDLCGVPVKDLSYAIASMHTYMYDPSTHNYDDNTNAYLKACTYDYVTIIGHMDFPKYPCDYEKVIKQCKKYDKIVELNNASVNPNGSRIGAKENDYEILRLCKEYNVPILMGSDAHIKYEIGNVDYCIDLLQEINFPNELVLNYNKDLFEHYFKYR